MKKKTEIKIEKRKKKEKENVKKLKDQLIRALADYDNLRKRVDAEKDDFVRLANLKLIIKFLPILDMLYDAQKHLHDSGLAIAINEFEGALKDEGLEKIVSESGTKFNATVHEAVETVKMDGKKTGIIAEELLTGWRYVDGPVIRPSKVKVFG